MKSVKHIVTTFVILSTTLYTLLIAGTTGKISGTVKDSQTGEMLVGANVIIVGTTFGASTDIDGTFFIINVPPGEYTVRSSSLGYAAVSQTKVRVDIDQTTELNFSLTQEVIQSEEVIVVAQRPVVQKDVASSRANISVREIESLPVSTVTAVVSLQAGVQSGLVVRGGGADQTAFIVDGLTLRDERNNTPYSGISLSAVQDIQVQTGGFNAEYGNIRSGVVNVITKEGSPSKYSLSATVRYSPPTAKHFGPSIFNKDSYWIRPFVDPGVAFVGTKNGTWDVFTQQQYQEFEGWNSISQKSLNDKDPNNDITPEAAQRLFMFQHRKQGDITKPDYDIDAGFGGPVPGGEEMGNLRFFASYRGSKSMYVVPLSEEAYNDYNGQLRLTTDLTGSMKLMVQGMIGKQLGTNNNNAGLPGLFQSPTSIVSNMDRVSYIDARIYSNDYWAPSTISMYNLGGKFTHVITPSTFYEVSVNQQQYKYSTSPGRLRNTYRIYTFGGVKTDEGPFGFYPSLPTTGIGSGLRMSIGFSNSRDKSELTSFSTRFDITSQMNQYNNVKAGLEVVYTDNNVNYGSVDEYLPSGRSRSKWRTFPIRGALYIQDKLEFEGMIANIGLRMDYSDPSGYWYDFGPYNKAFSSELSLGLDTILAHIETKRNISFSPRIGVAFPVTEYSKLFFNYGHFRQMPTPENLYLIRRFSDNNQVTFMANPNNPLPKTVAYELGYEHSLFDEYLIRLSGYYKNVTDQITTVSYVSRDTKVNYALAVPNSYEDIRGFEITLTRNRGEWVNGFLNYTYMVRSTGRFGYRLQYESAADQRTYERNNRETDIYQTKPIPAPYARGSVDFFTPVDFMSDVELGGVTLLNEWKLNFTASWVAGDYFTWAGGGSAPGIQYNVQYKDNYNFDMRLSKNFKILSANIQLFMDVQNLFNIKNFSRYGFVDGKDYENYMKSLHLPASIGDPLNYGNIPGDDQPGDVRADGVSYQPIVSTTLASVTTPQSTAIYYDQRTKKYYEYRNGSFVDADPARLQKALDDKAYIDMPNMDYFVFLNPRDIFWGLKISFEF